MTLETGARLGPYEIIAPLGAGGMGEVYRARDTRLGRSVAIKVLPSDFAGDPHRRMRFEREAKAISALTHPNICALHDIGCENGVDYIVLEHCDGETLSLRLARGPLPIGDVVRYSIEIADALDKAHRSGVVHRDLKPSNIMITKSGVKVLDFGLAKLERAAAFDVSTAERMTEKGALLGTLQYMAPEVLRGNEADARSDVFAIGLVMYEMLTGKAAYTGTTRPEVIAGILEREPVSIGSVRSDAPPALVRLIDACLTKDPDERMQTAHDVLLHLKWITETSPAPAPARPKRFAAAFALAILALAAGSIATFFLMRRARPERLPVRRLALALPEDVPVLEVFGNSLAVSRDGKQLVYVGPQSALYVRNLDRLTVDRLPGTEGAFHPFFSPDGQWVGFEENHRLRKVPIAGGVPVTICEPVTSRGATWDDHDIITFAEAAAPLKRVPASGGTPQPIPSSADLRWPVLLPGGDLLVTRYDKSGDAARGEVGVFTTSDRTFRTLIRSAIHGQYAAAGYLIFMRFGTLYSVPFDPRTKKIRGEPQLLVDNVAFNPPQAISQAVVSGNTIYYLQRDLAKEQFQLVWSDRRGQLSPVCKETGPYARGNLALSPDGRQVLTDQCTQGECDIWRYEIDRAMWSRLTADGHSGNGTWSPDGRTIAYSSNRSGPFNIFVTSVGGSDRPRQVTHSGDDWLFAHSWSPDGKTLATFEGKSTTSGDIALLSIDGSRRTPFLTTPAIEADPQFSPDGRWIAYVSSHSGRIEVYIRAADGKGTMWKVSDGGGAGPRWRGDGRELFYRKGTSVLAVDLAAGSDISIGKPHVLFDGNFGNAYDVTRDGQRFLLVRIPEVPPRTYINVVEGLLQ